MKSSEENHNVSGGELLANIEPVAKPLNGGAAREHVRRPKIYARHRAKRVSAASKAITPAGDGVRALLWCRTREKCSGHHHENIGQ